MVKIKLVKIPRRPKASASIQVKENYLKKLSEVKRENDKRKSAIKRSKELDKRITEAIRKINKF